MAGPLLPSVRRNTRARSLVLLGACGVASALVYLVAFTLPYSLPSGLTQPLQHFGTLSGPPWGATLGLTLALALLFGFYLNAVRVCERLDRELPLADRRL